MLSAAALSAFLALNGAVPHQDQPPSPAPGRFTYGSTRSAPDLPNYAGVGAITSSPAARPGFQPPVISTGYFAPGPFGYGYGWDPVGGFTQGVASIVSSQGQFMIDAEQSRLVREQVKQARIDTRRRNFDEWLYEREHTPTLEDERERSRLEQLRRSRNDPPITEILSGTALNNLLNSILTMNPPSESEAPVVPLAPDVVKGINLSSGATTGSLGVLRDGGRLRWPLALQDEPFDELRATIDQLSRQSFQQAQGGEVDAKTLRELSKALEEITEKLQNNVGKISSNDYIPARRYLRELSSSLRTLQDANVANYATGKWAAHGDTVFALVSDMNRQGLRFAPAADGDTAAYMALHRALVAYEAGLHQIARR